MLLITGKYTINQPVMLLINQLTLREGNLQLPDRKLTDQTNHRKREGDLRLAGRKMTGQTNHRIKICHYIAIYAINWPINAINNRYRTADRANYLKASPLPPASLAVASPRVVGLVVWQ